MIKKSPASNLGLSVTLSSFIRIGLTTGLFLLMAVVNDSKGQSLFQQTREQCDECCDKSIRDDYYREQCRLKCSRNYDYCAEPKGTRPERPSSSNAETATQDTREPEPREQQVEQSPPQPRPRPQAQKPQFVWPNPLNLTPGRESEAAAHILALNGIPPQHPNYVRALGAIQGILTNFAKSNPSGGALPTAQLQGIIKQFR